MNVVNNDTFRNVNNDKDKNLNINKNSVLGKYYERFNAFLRMLANFIRTLRQRLTLSYNPRKQGIDRV